MSEAFKCDFCEEFKDGEPAEELFRQEHIDRQGTDNIHVADVCDDCWSDIGGDDE